MKYKLTPEQRSNRASIRCLGYLCKYHSNQYFMRIKHKNKHITYELWEYTPHSDAWGTSRQITEFKIKNEPNNFSWPWKEKLPNGK
jgi:hypothetical protein